MSTIEHEGKTYEVLSLDRISEITHAKTLSGAILSARSIDGFHYVYTDCENWEAVTTFCDEEFEIFGIQPLRLVPKEPVTFEAYAVRPIGAGQVLIVCPFEADLKRFRCVEIVEEAK